MLTKFDHRGLTRLPRQQQEARNECGTGKVWAGMGTDASGMALLVGTDPRVKIGKSFGAKKAIQSKHMDSSTLA